MFCVARFSRQKGRAVAGTVLCCACVKRWLSRERPSPIQIYRWIVIRFHLVFKLLTVWCVLANCANWWPGTARSKHHSRGRPLINICVKHCNMLCMTLVCFVLFCLAWDEIDERKKKPFAGIFFDAPQWALMCSTFAPELTFAAVCRPFFFSLSFLIGQK